MVTRDVFQLELEKRSVVQASTDPVTGRIKLSVAGDDAQNAISFGGQKIILIGDSLTAYHGGTSIATPAQALAPSYDAKGFFNWANVMLGHPFDVVGNAGIGGQTSSQISARFATDVLAYNSDWVQILAGTNDDDSSFNTKVNLQSMYDRALADGRKVLALTIPPTQSTTTAKRQWHLSVNRWIVQYARSKKNIIVANIGSAIHDISTTWQPVSGALFDGTHPSATGAVAMGRMIYEALKTQFCGSPTLLGMSSGDNENLISNPMLYGTGTTAPTGWSVSGGATVSYVARNDGLAGNVCQLAAAAGSNAYMTSNASIGASLAVGDVVVGVLEFELDSLDAAAAANTQAVTMKLQAYNGSSFFDSIADVYWDTSYTNAKYPLAVRGVLMTPKYTVPVGSTLIQIYPQFRGGGNYRVSRAGIFKV